jgi:hypothetical protein
MMRRRDTVIVTLWLITLRSDVNITVLQVHDAMTAVQTPIQWQLCSDCKFISIANLCPNNLRSKPESDIWAAVLGSVSLPRDRRIQKMFAATTICIPIFGLAQLETGLFEFGLQNYTRSRLTYRYSRIRSANIFMPEHRSTAATAWEISNRFEFSILSGILLLSHRLGNL